MFQKTMVNAPTIASEIISNNIVLHVLGKYSYAGIWSTGLTLSTSASGITSRTTSWPTLANTITSLVYTILLRCHTLRHIQLVMEKAQYDFKQHFMSLCKHKI